MRRLLVKSKKDQIRAFNNNCKVFYNYIRPHQRVGYKNASTGGRG